MIGASMGGVDALRRLVARLPADLPASVFVVLHTADRDSGLLVRVLGNGSSLPVATAAEGERFAPGNLYVAPPDRHLIVGHDHLHVRRGPRENGARPAIDPLFRSAAANCTTRVIGVVLTGLLNDGTAGLQAIKRCDGLAVVQDPGDAAYEECRVAQSDMFRSITCFASKRSRQCSLRSRANAVRQLATCRTTYALKHCLPRRSPRYGT